MARCATKSFGHSEAVARVGLGRRCSGYKPDNDLGHFFAFVFLQKVAGAEDRRVWLVACAGHKLMKDGVAALCYRVAITKHRQERLFPLLKLLPCLAVGQGFRVVGRSSTSMGKARAPAK